MAHSEEIDKPFEITNVLSTIFFFDTYAEMTAVWNEDHPDDYEDPNDPISILMGFSYCEHYEERNFAHCDLYLVRPTEVDDDETLTIGHELLHGVYGEEYHN